MRRQLDIKSEYPGTSRFRPLQDPLLQVSVSRRQRVKFEGSPKGF